MSIIRNYVELGSVNNHDEFTLSLGGRLNELQAVYQLKAPFKKNNEHYCVCKSFLINRNQNNSCFIHVDVGNTIIL